MSHFVFPKWTNALLPMIGVGVLAAPLYAVGMVWFGFSPLTTDVGYAPEQPVPFSHKVHAGDLGIDCRYCHNTVDRAAKAAIPPTQTCMNCHVGIRPESQRLAPVRQSFEDGTPVLWRRVHDEPDYVYFNHAAHVNRGVSCVECHGRVDKMEVVYQYASLSMGWCLECHRNPDLRLREPKDVFNLGLNVGDDVARAELGRMIRERHAIDPSTDCSTCHR
ncbi:MAG: cytochrome c3 family protein [Phycisphaeraceae bacterium]|nr:cytochrome c family protein [Phycisphaerales bacterium]QOJ17919.1 MAG: cytochrome c3 family protein [Phycisphaeraceae bacterium]